MGSTVLDECDQFVHSGIAAQNDFRFDDAALDFWKALACLDKLPAEKPRRDKTRSLAPLFLKAGHEDLALLASREAIRLDETLGDQTALASDLIFYGNIQTRLGNIEEAKSTFRETIKTCVPIGRYADAAGASTNLAALYAEEEDIKQATELLRNSLDYLEKDPYPDTEFNTHATLIQVVALFDGDPTLAVTSGIALTKKFTDRLTEQHRKVLGPLLSKMADAFLAQKGEKNPAAWKALNLPWLEGDVLGSV